MIQTVHDALHVLVRAQPAWVAAGLALYVTALFTAGVRWRLIVRALGGAITWPDATKATVAGVFVNNVTPTGRVGGEACRIGLTRLRGRLTVARGALATLCDRLSDVPGIAVLVLLALPTLRPMLTARAGVILLGAAAVVVAGSVLARWLRVTLRAWLSAWRRDLRAAPVSARLATAALSCSAVIWIEDLLRILVVCRAFDVTLSTPEAAALCVIALVTGFAPSIGGLGAVEGGLVGGLAFFGVPVEIAIAVTTVERAISYGFSTAAGGIVLGLMGGRGLLRAAMSGRTEGGTAPPHPANRR